MTNIAGIWQEMIGLLHQRLDELIAGIDWSKRPPHERMLADSWHVNIDGFAEEIARSGDWLAEKFAKLEALLPPTYSDHRIARENATHRGMRSRG